MSNSSSSVFFADPLPVKALLGSALLHGCLLFLILPFSRDDSQQSANLVSSWAAESVEVGVEPAAAPLNAASPPPATPGEREQVAQIPAAPTGEAPRRSTPAAPMTANASRPKRADVTRSPRHAQSAAASASGSARPSTPSAAASAAADGPAGSLGMLGLPPGVQHFAKAFAWALPEGGHRDAVWSELPLGPVGKAIVEFRISAEGRIEKVELDPDLDTPQPLRRMIDHAVFLLRPRTFSLDARAVSHGVERLSIEVSLSQLAPSGDEDDNPRDLATEGHKPPETERPGYARFTLNSGRHLEAVLRRLPSR